MPNDIRTTDDPTDPRLGRGPDNKPVPQNEVYLVLSDDERAKGYIRPFRDTYKHLKCGTKTSMGFKLSATYAREPTFYGSTYCCSCQMHRPVGPDGEFEWLDGTKVGT